MPGFRERQDERRRRFKQPPTAEEFRQRRRERMEEERNRRRQEALTRRRQARLAMIQRYADCEFYYVVHGHALVPHQVSHSRFRVPDNVQVVFYCREGETSADAERRQRRLGNPNATWPQLLNRLTIGMTNPPSQVEGGRIGPGQNCEPLYLVPQRDVPRNGIYFVCRRPGQNAPECTLLRPLLQQGEFLSTLIRDVISPDERQRYLSLHRENLPLKVHFIGCRWIQPAPASAAAQSRP